LITRQNRIFFCAHPSQPEVSTVSASSHSDGTPPFSSPSKGRKSSHNKSKELYAPLGGRTPTGVEALADAICDEIERKGLQKGDLFMTEGELSEKYGVSRTLAREAVSRMQELGVLTSRQRKGLVVGRPNPVALMRRALPFYGRSPRQTLEVAQMRYALEVGAVDLAARNASETQLQQLHTTSEEYCRAVEENEPSIMVVFIDTTFHSLILQMTGNPLIAGMHYVLEEHFRWWKEARDERLNRMNPGQREQSLRESIWGHRMITRALMRRDAEQARAFLREHLKKFIDDAEQEDLLRRRGGKTEEARRGK
jgi:DNA-binding FadR family transcriptional regulator